MSCAGAIVGTAKKRIQNCSSCKNHGLKASKTGHRCPYKVCDCILCRLLRQSQKVMCHQQRFWRHQKLRLDENERKPKGVVCQQCRIKSNSEVNKKHKKCLDFECSCEWCNRGQVCDKCRNHNKLVPKKNHKCPNKSCECEYCTLTFKRREIMKHLQRVKRSGVISSANPEVVQAEDLLKQNQTDYSFINEASTPEEDVDYDDDLSAGDQEDEVIDRPKRQPSSDMFVHKKKQRLLSSRNMNFSPPLMRSPVREVEEPKTPLDLPQLVPYEPPPSVSQCSDTSELPSTPPPLIPVKINDQEYDEEEAMRDRRSRTPDNVLNLQRTVSCERFSRDNHLYLHPNTYWTHHRPPPPMIQPDSTRLLPFRELDIGSTFKPDSSLREALIQSSKVLHHYYPLPIRPHPSYRQPFFNSFMFHPVNMLGRHNINLSSGYQADKLAHLLHPPTRRSSDDIYID